MSNLIRTKQIAAGTNGQVLTTTGGVTTWANNVDLYITGTTFNTGNYQLLVERNDGTTFTEDLSILSSDMVVTGGTYNINTGVVTFTNNSGGTFNVTGFSSGMTDTYVTGGTVAYIDEDGTATYTKNDASTFQVTGFKDTNITGGTYSNATGDVTLTKNDGTTVVVDLSAMDLNDTYTTGTTLVGSTLYFDTTDALSAYTADLSPLLDDTNFYATGATLVGTTAYFDRNDTLSAFTLDLSAIDQAVPSISNKEEAVTGTTSGDEARTFITMAATPAADGYVGVSVNGILYIVGDGVKTKDAYFSADGGTTAKAMTAIASGDELIWNGVIAGFNLETTDNIALYYDL